MNKDNKTIEQDMDVTSVDQILSIIEDFKRDNKILINANLKKENTFLRGLVAKLNIKCVHCGNEDISKCPEGLPGCSKADDLFCADDETLKRLIDEKAELKRENEEWKKKYYDVADAICRSSNGVEDLCKQARGIRFENADLKKQLEQALRQAKKLEINCRPYGLMHKKYKKLEKDLVKITPRKDLWQTYKETYDKLLDQHRENNDLRKKAQKLVEALGNIMQYLHDTDELGNEYLTVPAKQRYEAAKSALKEWREGGE